MIAAMAAEPPEFEWCLTPAMADNAPVTGHLRGVPDDPWVVGLARGKKIWSSWRTKHATVLCWATTRIEGMAHTEIYARDDWRKQNRQAILGHE